MKRLLLIATMALCSMPKIESSFFAPAAATVWKYSGHAMNALLLVGSTIYYEICASSLHEQINSDTIAHAQEIAQLQSASKKQFAIVAGAALCIGGYLWINHKYKQFLNKRPTIAAIIESTKTVQDAIATLQKQRYTQNDFIAARATLPKKFATTEIEIIEAALSTKAQQTTTVAPSATTATQTPTQTAVRPTINAILAATKTTQEAAAELKKHKYTKLELMTTCILTQNIKGKDIQAIEKLLA